MPEEPSPDHVFLVLSDAREEAESASPQLQEVTELMGRAEYTRALGAFNGLEERVHYIGVVLRRFARYLGLQP